MIHPRPFLYQRETFICASCVCVREREREERASERACACERACLPVCATSPTLSPTDPVPRGTGSVGDSVGEGAALRVVRPRGRWRVVFKQGVAARAFARVRVPASTSAWLSLSPQPHSPNPPSPPSSALSRFRSLSSCVVRGLGIYLRLWGQGGQTLTVSSGKS